MRKGTATLELEPTQYNSLDRLQTRKYNHITVYVSGYTETDRTAMLSPNSLRLYGPTKYVSSQQPGQTPAAISI